jgi:hypothetical protein
VLPVGVRDRPGLPTGPLGCRFIVDLVEFELATPSVELFEVPTFYLFIGA